MRSQYGKCHEDSELRNDIFGFPADCRDARVKRGEQREASAGVWERDDGGPKAGKGGCSVSGEGGQTLDIL